MSWESLAAEGGPLWLHLAPGLPPQRFWAQPHPEGGWWLQGPRGQAWRLPALAAPGALGGASAPGPADSGLLNAPMAARVVALHAAEGEAVAAGQALLSLEAMKLRLPMAAPRAGRVRWRVAEGEEVKAGTVLALVAEADPEAP